MSPDTFLLRQVHPKWNDDGQVSYLVFKPFPKDRKMLSVYDGKKIAAREAWCHYTSTLGLRSDGVLAVTVDECQQADLLAVPDPEPFPEHAYIDFSKCEDKQMKVKAMLLQTLADRRGWLHKS